MTGNTEILVQGGITIGTMILILSPEIYALYKGIPSKGLVCLLGIISKVATIYFFASTIAGTFLN